MPIGSNSSQTPVASLLQWHRQSLPNKQDSGQQQQQGSSPRAYDAAKAKPPESTDPQRALEQQQQPTAPTSPAVAAIVAAAAATEPGSGRSSYGGCGSFYSLIQEEAEQAKVIQRHVNPLYQLPVQCNQAAFGQSDSTVLSASMGGKGTSGGGGIPVAPDGLLSTWVEAENLSASPNVSPRIKQLQASLAGSRSAQSVTIGPHVRSSSTSSAYGSMSASSPYITPRLGMAPAPAGGSQQQQQSTVVPAGTAVAAPAAASGAISAGTASAIAAAAAAAPNLRSAAAAAAAVAPTATTQSPLASRHVPASPIKPLQQESPRQHYMRNSSDTRPGESPRQYIRRPVAPAAGESMGLSPMASPRKAMPPSPGRSRGVVSPAPAALTAAAASPVGGAAGAGASSTKAVGTPAGRTRTAGTASAVAGEQVHHAPLGAGSASAVAAIGGGLGSVYEKPKSPSKGLKQQGLAAAMNLWLPGGRSPRGGPGVLSSNQMAAVRSRGAGVGSSMDSEVFSGVEGKPMSSGSGATAAGGGGGGAGAAGRLLDKGSGGVLGARGGAGVLGKGAAAGGAVAAGGAIGAGRLQGGKAAGGGGTPTAAAKAGGGGSGGGHLALKPQSPLAGGMPKWR